MNGQEVPPPRVCSPPSAGSWADGTLVTIPSKTDERGEAKRGLWVDPNPVPPWEWRHRRD